LAEATALLTELENQETVSETEAAGDIDVDTSENTLSTVHFTTDPGDENEVFDQHV